MSRSYTKEQLDKLANTLAKHAAVDELWCSKRPDTNEPWVGIEIEFYLKDSRFLRMLANSDIAKYVSVSEDGSIEINQDDELPDDWAESGDWNTFELQICSPESKIHQVLGKACSILRYVKAKTNSSCGLHVHIDHRIQTGRNPVVTFNNLLKMQGVLFGVTDPGREDSEYCQWVDNDSNFYSHMFRQMSESDYDEDSRYYAINLIALRDSQTIEVRIFGGTTKYREICHYLNLVVGSIKSNQVEESITENNVDIVKTIPYSTRNFVKSKLRKVA